MNTQGQIAAALADFGVSDVAFLPVEGTDLTAVRVTDQPYRDHEVAKLLAEIIRPLAPVNSVASNALYDGDDRLGAVIFIHA